MDLYLKCGLSSSVVAPPRTDERIACSSCTLLERDYTLVYTYRNFCALPASVIRCVRTKIGRLGANFSTLKRAGSDQTIATMLRFGFAMTDPSYPAYKCYITSTRGFTKNTTVNFNATGIINRSRLRQRAPNGKFHPNLPV